MTLTLNRPEKLNAVTYSVIGQLLEHLQAAKEDPEVRAVAITGAGRAFSAGDDVRSMGEPPYPCPPGEHPVRFMQQRLIKLWYWFPKPTVAGVHGRCHGIGQDIVLAADFRVVSFDTVFGDLRARRAVPIGSGGTYLLPRMIGLPAATRIILTGATIDGTEMERLGLANALVDRDKLEEELASFAAGLAQAPTKALGIMKREMRSNLGARSLDDALNLELELLDTPVEDRAEGAKSFAEGRPAVFTGR